MSTKYQVVKQNLSEKAVRNLKSRFLYLELKPGTRLIIEALMKEMEISFTPVREALRELVKEGLVKYNGNSYTVVKYSPKEIEDIFAIRTSLEVLAVQLVSDKITQDLIDQLKLCCYESELAIENENYSRLTELDIKFHATIAKAAGNTQLEQILNNIREKGWFIRRWVFGLRKYEESERKAIAEHNAVLKELITGNAKGLASSMQNHMEKAKERTSNALNEGYGSDKNTDNI